MTFEFTVSKLLCCAPQLKLTILVIKGAALVIIVDAFALKSLGIHLTWGCRWVFTLKSLSLKYQNGIEELLNGISFAFRMVDHLWIW